MLKNYILIAIRSFLRNKVYASLNILGLTVGISAALIIFLFVQDELTYDQNHQQSSRIFRVNGAYHLPNNGGFEEYAVTGPIVGEMIQKDFPEVKQMVRFVKLENQIIEKPGTQEKIYETFFAADSNAFDVFTFSLISGNADNALDEIYSVVITEDMAKKYFGRTDVLGETLYLLKDSLNLKITGVMKNYPSNTQLKFDFIVPLEMLKSRGRVSGSWWSYGYYTYLELKPETNAKELENKIKFISRNYIANQEEASGYKQEYSLIPFSDIHLNSALRTELEANSKAPYVYIFLVIGIFILLIACINFMNLATAKSAMRAKEIGLRKVIGAIRSQLIHQFLSEAFLMVLFALVISLGIVYVALPYVNDFTDKNISLFSNTWLWIILFGIVSLVTLLSGSYPSIFLSAFKPVETLKGSFKNSAKGNLLRQSLVVFQFFISIFLIAGTLVVYRHFIYLRSADLGFSKDKVIFIPSKSAAHSEQDFTVLKNELEKLPGISAASVSASVPGKEMLNNVVLLGWDESAKYSDMRLLTADEDFMKVYNFQLADGRWFSKDYASDATQGFIVNESGMRRLGFLNTKDALGQKVRLQNRKGYIIGVIKDFHYMSTNVAIEPFMVAMNWPWSVEYISVKLSSGSIADNVERIKETFHTVLPDKIFEYGFLDEDFDQQYKSEERFASIFTSFAIIAILIACLGLYGLAMFVAEQKFKEIGIRKVLGANASGMVMLQVKDFMKLVLIAFVIASPLSYYFLKLWLQNFPKHEPISILYFIVAGVLVMIIALVTVSFQSVKAAMMDPVKSISQQ